MSKNRKKHSVGKAVACILLGLTALALFMAAFMRGNNVALVHTKGMVANEQLNLMVITIGVMLLIAVPALLLLYYTAWKYRESNNKATYDSTARHGRFFVLSMWVVPTIVAVILAAIMWPATHKLEPNKAIAADAKPLTIQVVSMRWKWLFIYPEQNIATVNFVQIPVGTPVEFDLTADESPMSSFWIPNLGGMLYAMTGHVNQLNLIADAPGDYPGSSGEINGPGFAGMKFTARASSMEDFNSWVLDVKRSSDKLNAAEYDKLVQPSEDNPAAFYSAADKGLYDRILKKYTGPSGGHMSHGAHE